MTADLPAAIRALYRKGWTTAAGTPCVLVRDVERVLGEWEGEAGVELCDHPRAVPSRPCGDCVQNNPAYAETRRRAQEWS